MKIEYIEYSVPNSSGASRDDALELFLTKLPGCGMVISRGHLFPPRNALNELLTKGKHDAGMSGVFEWEPIELDEAGYAKLKMDLEDMLGVGLKIQFEEILSFEEWFQCSLASISSD